jgi:hypothetical protein
VVRIQFVDGVKVKVKLSLCLTNYALHHEDVWGSGCIDHPDIGFSIVLFLFTKHRPVYISKHNVSETGFRLRPQMERTQLGPIDRASPYLRTPAPTPDRVYKLSTNHLQVLRRSAVLGCMPHLGTGLRG